MKYIPLLLLFYTITFADNSLPQNRQGEWRHAGYLRFLQEAIVVDKINNITSYGADNDGHEINNKNYRAIMKAIADTAPDAITMIFFPAGTYRVSAPIHIDKSRNLILRGNGSDSTRLIFNFNGNSKKNCITVSSSELIGIENLYIEREDSTDFGDNISIRSKNCWVSGVESYRAVSSHIAIYSSKNIDVLGCHIHHAWNYGTGGHGYGVVIGEGSEKCLVENNIFNHLRHAVILSNGPRSNVIAYNYSTDPFTTEKYLRITDWPADLCLHGHPDHSIPGPERNLFEGNVCAFMHADGAWKDNGPYNTFFRNRATYYGIKIHAHSDSQNIIANEVNDADGSLMDMFWNAFKINSRDNYVMGNTNRDPDPDKYPFPKNYSSDLSLYFSPDSIPRFLHSLPIWPPIGVVDANHRGGGTIPAKLRWDKNGLLTVLHPEY